MTTAERPVRRKQFTGVVVAARRMKRTVTVEVERFPRHAKLRTQYRRTQWFLVDDPKEEAAAGDRVLIEETRPLSRRKHFRLVKVVARGVRVSRSPGEHAPRSSGVPELALSTLKP